MLLVLSIFTPAITYIAGIYVGRNWVKYAKE
jgi:hypothetical protein